jgi:AraC family transcriptional regulator
MPGRGVGADLRARNYSFECGAQPLGLFTLEASVELRDAGMTETRLQSAIGVFDRATVAGLIVEARSSFESNRSKAKRCLQDAVDLIRGKDLLQTCSPTPLRGGLRGWQLRQVRAYIEANIGAKIHIADLAARAHLSTAHFARSFKKSAGMSPQAYVMSLRIQQAQALMLTSNDSLARIASECGLCDQAHFSRVFRRLVGRTPRDWRRQGQLTGP